MRRSNLRTTRAWALNEQAMKLWDFKYVTAARNHFNWWYRWATRSRLKPMIEKAKMLVSHLPNILTYLKHGITNAASESINSKINGSSTHARGFRNFDNFKTRFTASTAETLTCHLAPPKSQKSLNNR